MLVALVPCLLKADEEERIYHKVSLRNGNFFLNMQDCVVPRPHFPDRPFILERSYNSQTADSFSFGVGWGSSLFHTLKILGDNTLKVRMFGGGTVYHFKPPFMDTDVQRSHVEENAKEISSLWDKSLGFASESEMTMFTEDMLGNEYSVRDEQWGTLIDQGLVSHPVYPPGTRFQIEGEMVDGKPSYIYSITVMDEGYVLRDHGVGYKCYFDLNGRLTATYYGTGPYYEYYLYDDNGYIRGVRDSEGMELDFMTDDQGKITEVHLNGEPVVRYKYEAGVLIESIDSDGRLVRYAYDDYDNLTHIEFVTEGKEMTMRYAEDGNYLTVLVDTEGRETRYAYGLSETNPDTDYWALEKRPFGPFFWLYTTTTYRTQGGRETVSVDRDIYTPDGRLIPKLFY